MFFFTIINLLSCPNFLSVDSIVFFIIRTQPLSVLLPVLLKVYLSVWFHYIYKSRFVFQWFPSITNHLKSRRYIHP